MKYFGIFHAEAKELKVPLLDCCAGAVGLGNTKQADWVVDAYNAYAYEWDYIEHLPRTEENDQIWRDYMNGEDKFSGAKDTTYKNYVGIAFKGEWAVTIMLRGAAPFRSPVNKSTVTGVYIHYFAKGIQVAGDSFDQWLLVEKIKGRLYAKGRDI
ncbi:hypothetical protein [Leptothrix discophora]|uniref:SnoaL-like domain-containing protein n=1 Tax=Leptothrix discophora TaxID=89 RepID=A0ABT9G0E2_LEPDI|nr:hypothetical protein [Leptothrix discophora]MDP4299947.1 hypothetical protein [Leptothrix discophora]